MINKLKKKIGLTWRFMNRKKKKKFNIISFLRFAFRNFGNHAEAEYKYRHYRRIEEP